MLIAYDKDFMKLLAQWQEITRTCVVCVIIALGMVRTYYEFLLFTVFVDMHVSWELLLVMSRS